MTDGKLKSLTRRIEEKLNSGYEMVTKVKKVTTGGSNYIKGYGGKYENKGFDFNTKWQVVMRKVN